MGAELRVPNLEQILAVAIAAGKAIARIYHCQEQLDVNSKPDDTPVTTADLKAHEIICAKLATITPQIPILSEEDCNIGFVRRSGWQRYWLVDPLDGTREFLAKNADFTVNIALIDNHQPILGVVYIPLTEVAYYADVINGAFVKTASGQATPIRTRSYQAGTLAVTLSRRHGIEQLTDLLANLPAHEVITAGSSLKMCLLAEGRADLYPRLSPTSEWDTAASHCILQQAGGQLLDLSGQPLRYNTKDSLLNPSFIGVADPTMDWLQFLPTS